MKKGLKFTVVVIVILLSCSCQKEFAIKVMSNDAAMGSVSGGGVYAKGTVIQLHALPATGCRFEKWNDGNTLNPRSVTVNSNATYTAEFVIEGNGGGGEEPSKKPGFSVSASQQVYFSPGNLQWSATNGGSDFSTHTVADGTAAGTWRFAPNQWDIIGAGNSNISSNDTGWIDLFGWGTSGYNNRHPYTTIAAYYNYGDGNNHLSGTNYDWGVYNAIYNPSTRKTDAPGTWRTLTKDEWDYLLNTRNTSSGIRYAKGTVCGISGLILVPDNWKTSVYPLNNTNNSAASYTYNTIDATDWNKMENAGCAFIPAAGLRNETSVSYCGTSGYYWSATYYGIDAYSLIFDFSNLTSSINFSRYYGNSIRLVSNVR